MKNSLKGVTKFGALLIAIGMLAAVAAAFVRFRTEAGNRRVELAIEWAEVSNLAQFSPRPLKATELLGQFKVRGVTGLIIAEDTVTTLEQMGALRADRALTATGAVTRVTVDTPRTLARIREALTTHGIQHAAMVAGSESLLPATGTLFTLSSNSASDSIYIPVDYLNLRTLGVGLPPDAVHAAHAEGMSIIGRIANFSGATSASAEAALRSLKKQGAGIVIFTGDEVLGYRGNEKAVADTLRDLSGGDKAGAVRTAADATGKLFYGAVEFGKQRGDEKVSTLLKGDFVRVHSIQTTELGAMTDVEAVDRYVRAARERNIRLCYIRMLTFTGSDPVRDNLAFVSDISRGIVRGSRSVGGEMQFGPARPFPNPAVPKLLYAVMGLGVAAGLVWMIALCKPLTGGLEILLLIVFGVLFMVMVGFGGETGKKLVALAAGIAFPAAACLKLYPGMGRSNEGASPVLVAIKGLAAASSITTIGILYVIGLLASRPFMMHSNQFLGIKVQHAIPILIIAFLACVGGPALPSEGMRRFRRRISERIRELWADPVTIGLLVLGIVSLAALVLIVARTGNDSGIGVSGIELKFRSILDRLLPVRPRTKEFLVGHPAFVLALAWWARGRKKLAIPAFVVGSIGQVSLLNTFCHIHTPLLVSLWRDGIGLVFGAMIGIAIYWVMEKLLPAPDASRDVAPDSTTVQSGFPER